MKILKENILLLACCCGIANTSWLAWAFLLNYFPEPLERNLAIRTVEFIYMLFSLILIIYLTIWVFKKLNSK